MTPPRLVHHELCFGCGRINLFGLLMELERTEDGRVLGRGFIKQDHQGPRPGTAHEGILAAALSEAMSFACGAESAPVALELELSGPAPVGAFLEVEADARKVEEGKLEATASASIDGRAVAAARGRYRRG